MWYLKKLNKYLKLLYQLPYQNISILGLSADLLDTKHLATATDVQWSDCKESCAFFKTLFFAWKMMVVFLYGSTACAV